MTETYVEVEQPTAPENPTLKVRNVSTVVGANTVLHQVTMSAKEDGTIIAPATSDAQTTGNASLSSIDGKTPALGQALAAASVPVVLTAAQVTTLTPPAAITGFATAAKQPALGTAGSASTDVITVQGIASGVAQPVSLASVPSHAVTNVGTFAVQSRDAVATAEQPGAQSSVTGTSGTVLSANSARKGAKLYADPTNTQIVYVKLGATATASNFPLNPGDSIDLNFGGAIYTGVVDAISASGTQKLNVMEI